MHPRAKKCYEKNKIKYDKASLDWYENNPRHDLLRNAKKRAKARSIECTISVEDFEIPNLCPVLGCEMIKRTRTAPSLDRIDPDKGYIKGNVQVISTLANTMKNNASVEDLRSFANWVTKTYPL